MNKILGIIYKSTNLINGKCYIGQTIQEFDERKNSHFRDAIRYESHTYFHNAIRKYGIENFKWEVIYECDDPLILGIMETMKIIVNHSHVSEGLGYNLTWGGEDNPMNYPEIRRRMADKIKEIWDIPENHKRFCDCMKGKKVDPFTDEHKEKLSIGKMGNKNPNYNKKMKKTSLEKRSKNVYSIQYPDGHIEFTKVLSCWCRENDLNYDSLLCYVTKGLPYKGYVINKKPLICQVV